MLPGTSSANQGRQSPQRHGDGRGIGCPPGRASWMRASAFRPCPWPRDTECSFRPIFIVSANFPRGRRPQWVLGGERHMNVARHASHAFWLVLLPPRKKSFQPTINLHPNGGLRTSRQSRSDPKDLHKTQHFVRAGVFRFCSNTQHNTQHNTIQITKRFRGAPTLLSLEPEPCVGSNSPLRRP